VGRPIKRRAHTQRPKLMKSGAENAECGVIVAGMAITGLSGKVSDEIHTKMRCFETRGVTMALLSPAMRPFSPGTVSPCIHQFSRLRSLRLLSRDGLTIARTCSNGPS
jgi:hypothetical protein